jgi:hypothetical protein
MKLPIPPVSESCPCRPCARAFTLIELLVVIAIKWSDPRTMPPLSRKADIPLDQPSPNNRDVLWMQERSTRRPQ